jgi:hypothetical protein
LDASCGSRIGTAQITGSVAYSNFWQIFGKMVF